MLYLYRLIAILLLLPWVAIYATTYYVTNNGNDTNDGLSEATPWQTLNQVNAVVFPNYSTILFKRGEVFRGKISPQKSPVGLTFGAYSSGDNPIISGSVVITGWTPTTHPGLSPNVYEAKVTSLPLGNSGIEQLFVNGELMTIARYPNVNSPAEKNWLRVGTEVGTNAFVDPALKAYSKLNDYWKGATLRIRNYSWTYTILPITRYSASKGRLTVSGLGEQLPEWGYFIDGKLEELDTPGEWYYQASSNKVYLYPKGGIDPNTVLIEGTTYPTGLSITNGENYTTVENLTFRHFTSKGVLLSGSNHGIIRNCRFEHNVTGIYLWNAADALIQGNQLDHQLDTAIVLQADNRFQVKNSVVEYNQISHTAMYPAYGERFQGVYQGVGINVFGKSFTVRKNVVENTSWSGIALKEDGYHLIENNIVRNSLLLLNDGGAILISSDRNTIRGNLLLSSVGNVDESNGCMSLNSTPCHHHTAYGMGIGADDGFKYNLIENNTIANNLDTGIRLNAFSNTTVRNNLLYNNDPQIALESNKGPSRSNRIEGNLIYSLHPEQIGLSIVGSTSITTGSYLSSPLGGARTSSPNTLVNNYYCNPYSEVVIDRENRPYSLAHWQTQFSGSETNSTQCQLHFPEYTVTSVVGANLILNSTFDNDVSNWANSGRAWISHDLTQVLLNGGNLKSLYDKPKSFWNSDNRNANIIPNSFELTANQSYRLKFSVVGNGFGNIQLRTNDTNPTDYQILAERQFAYDTSRKDYEYIFPSPKTTPYGKHLFITHDYDANTYWLDNVTFEVVTTVRNDATQTSVLCLNPMDVAQDLPLEEDKTYVELNGTPVVGTVVTVAPFSAKILLSYP